MNRAAATIDAAYHLVYEELKLGVREIDIVTKVSEFHYRDGSDDVEALTPSRARALWRASKQFYRPDAEAGRPGVLRYPAIIHGYRTCDYHTFNVGRATPA